MALCIHDLVGELRLRVPIYYSMAMLLFHGFTLQLISRYYYHYFSLLLLLLLYAIYLYLPGTPSVRRVHTWCAAAAAPQLSSAD